MFIYLVERQQQPGFGEYRAHVVVAPNEVIARGVAAAHGIGLLARYMRHVGEQEGVDFTDSLSDLFTETEKEVLRDISVHGATAWNNATVTKLGAVTADVEQPDEPRIILSG